MQNTLKLAKCQEVKKVLQNASSVCHEQIEPARNIKLNNIS